MNQFNIWVPPTAGYRAEAQARAAAKEYDEDLDFGRNEATGQWCVFLRQGTTQLTAGRNLPVLGFDHVPTPDEIKRKLYLTDARRRGLEIVDEIQRHNDQIQENFDEATNEAARETAEAFEWGFRKLGKTEHKRVFLGGN
jgi:hypothetical protein